MKSQSLRAWWSQASFIFREHFVKLEFPGGMKRNAALLVGAYNFIESLQGLYVCVPAPQNARMHFHDPQSYIQGTKAPVILSEVWPVPGQTQSKDLHFLNLPSQSLPSARPLDPNSHPCTRSPSHYTVILTLSVVKGKDPRLLLGSSCGITSECATILPRSLCLPKKSVNLV